MLIAGKEALQGFKKRLISLLLVLALGCSPLGEGAILETKTNAFWDYALDVVSVGVSAQQCLDGQGDNILDCSLLGLDLFLAILPFAPSGAGVVNKGVKLGETAMTKGDDLIGAMRGFSNVYDAIDEGYPILNSLDDLAAGKTTLGRIGTLKGIGNGVQNLERHHLVPEALAEALGMNADNLTGVLMTRTFHRGKGNVITNPLNRLIERFRLTDGTYDLAGTNLPKVINGVTKVYQGNKVVQAAAVLDILKSPTGLKWLSGIGLTMTGIQKVVALMNQGNCAATNADDCGFVTVEELERVINANRPAPYKPINLTGSDPEVDALLSEEIIVPGVPDAGVPPQEAVQPALPPQIVDKSGHYTSHFYYSQYVNGTYTGQHDAQGRPHGYGTLVYGAASLNRTSVGISQYEGNWQHGVPYGFGTVTVVGDSQNGQNGWRYYHGQFYGWYASNKLVREVYWHNESGSVAHEILYALDTVTRDDSRSVMEFISACPHEPQPPVDAAAEEAAREEAARLEAEREAAAREEAARLEAEREAAALREAAAEAFAYSDASSWARDAIISAYAKELIPGSMLRDYTAPANRIDFANMAYRILQSVVDMGDWTVTEHPFRDVGYSEEVAVLYGLGIITGRSADRFAPFSPITRQEAAVLLDRLCQYLCYGRASGHYFYEGSVRLTYADNEKIADWAYMPVYGMRQLGIMEGVGNNLFAPTADFTCEQTIVTMLRVLETA